MKCIESTSESVHLPAGLILIYPCLSFDLACWMPTNHMNLIRAESVKSLPNLLKRTSPIEKGSPLSLPEAPKKIDISSHISGDKKSCSFWSAKEAEIQIHLPSSLSMTSRMSYFADRLISPERECFFVKLRALIFQNCAQWRYCISRTRQCRTTLILNIICRRWSHQTSFYLGFHAHFY